MRGHKLARPLGISSILVALSGLVGAAAPSPSVATNVASASVTSGKFRCNSVCVPCVDAGADGYYFDGNRPLLDDSNVATTYCNPGASCSYCSGELVELLDEVENAVSKSDWARVTSLSHLDAADVVVDPIRSVVDIVACDGVSVAATFPMRQQFVSNLTSVPDLHIGPFSF